MRYARGTAALPTAAQLNDNLGVLAFQGYGATGFVDGAALLAQAAENFTDAAGGTILSVQVAALGAVTFTNVAQFAAVGFAVGPTSQFAVATSDGNITKIKTVPYVWPGSNAVGVLTNDGLGNLLW